MADDWFARDKAQHLLVCMAIVLALGSALAFSSRFRAWRIRIACVASLAAGAAKEALDELHVWNSSGASAKDAVADIVGALVGAAALWAWPRIWEALSRSKTKEEQATGDHAV
ncbi:uncharacterized protein LOC112347273 [Selaginella moellendorffii]|uniref:uncharacterized protein LOC112347273 n=1 Tax=Selaginella moellendorffii TaxID=88036 RepID=UPI000D1CFC24|nr:uncharacterized protein LOC112347273 [Selaginella moellendorffii]|eukprot:XP_024533682.1 uncharacterized protein LOC112347273 [Selaginella moellendorffii]